MIAALRVVESMYERLDFLPDPWESLDESERGTFLAHWRTVMPSPENRAEAKGPAVDVEVLAELFARLEDETQGLADRVAFRFVVGLLLMRKKRLTFVSTESVGGNEVWQLRWRGGGEARMISPHLDEEALADVGQRVEALLRDGAEDAEAEGGTA